MNNHSDPLVCSAVSILSLNTVNSIEKFTSDKFLLDYDDKGGFLKFIIDNNVSKETTLLLDSLELGIKGILEQYSKHICIKYKEVL